MSARRPDLRVQVEPADDDGADDAPDAGEPAASASASGESGGSSRPPSGRWAKYSPGSLVARTSLAAAKFKRGLSSRPGSSRPASARGFSAEGRRSTVNPIARAAADARLRTMTLLREMRGGGGGKEAASEEESAPEAAEGVRFIRLRPGEPNTNDIEETNRVVTSKYNIVTFLPVFLFEMFSRVAYLYFLVQAGLSWWSVVSPYSGLGATAALLFVLAVAAVKAAFEDRKRHQEDKRMNTSVTHVLQPDGSVADVSWTDVRVGDRVVVRDGELFPADLLCLYSALPDRVCFIKTTNLDGETNLKIRRPLDARGVGAPDVAACAALDVDVRAELPNKNLHRFKGSATVRSEALRAAAPLSPGPGGTADGRSGWADGETPSVEVPITMNEMLLRGCLLKNSGCVVGLAVYTGRQTRIQMNAAKTPLKIGSFDRFLNLQISLIIAMQLAMCLFLAVANQVWVQNRGRDHYYLALTYYVEGVYESAVLQVVINFLTFWILLSYLVPISLFVTMEIVKFWQGFIFINLDKDMKDPRTGEGARTRNSNLNEDLGMVEYVFSDKTGTLTSNEMQLRCVSIKGAPYGRPDFELEAHPELRGAAALAAFDARLAAAAARVAGGPGWDGVVAAGGSRRELLGHHTSTPGPAAARELGVPFEEAAAGGDGDGAGAEAGALLGHHLVDFWTNVCLCQSLILEKDPTNPGGPALYQGPSPDEVALVEAARALGFEFVHRAQAAVTLRLLGREATFEVLNVMEYSSERGCMSVVVRAPDGTVRLHCKGSDAKVLKKVRPDTDPALLAATDADLHLFARRGLRTLVLGSRVLDEAEYAAWDARYQEASLMFEGREAALDALGAEVEAGLELVGVTAIEDKLQDGVPAAVATLLAAGVRVWMITGDKQETAVNIAVSCALVASPDDVMMLNVDERAEAAAADAAALLDGCLARLLARYNKESGAKLADADDVPTTWQRGELAVDGPTLHFLLGDPECRRKLAVLAARCSGVVVSRSSPSQKAAIVEMMKEYEMARAAGGSRGLVRWYRRYRRRLQGKMLAIGDGANDVAMIQTADVGVGIAGREGRQAVNNSDYAMSQFRFLVPLLLVHGTLSYYRLARLIKYSFYKNITFGFVMFYFQFYNGFSGQALVDSITAAVFNVVFTSLPILIFAVADRPVRDLRAFVRYPRLYDKRGGASLSTLGFWRQGVALGVLHAAAAFFVPYYSIVPAGGQHNIADVYSLGKVAFVALLGAVTIEVCLVARYWTWLFAAVAALSYALVYPYMVVFPAAARWVGYYDPANIGVSSAVLGSPTFWLVILVVYVLTGGQRLAERAALWAFRPHDTMVLAEREKLGRVREGLLMGLSEATRARLAELGMLGPGGSASVPPSEFSGSEQPSPTAAGVGAGAAAAAGDDSLEAWSALAPGGDEEAARAAGGGEVEAAPAAAGAGAPPEARPPPARERKRRVQFSSHVRGLSQ